MTVYWIFPNINIDTAIKVAAEFGNQKNDQFLPPANYSTHKYCGKYNSIIDNQNWICNMVQL